MHSVHPSIINQIRSGGENTTSPAQDHHSISISISNLHTYIHTSLRQSTTQIINMPSIPLHPRSSPPTQTTTPNPLPPLLHTPSGLAILEMQGTINAPSDTSSPSSSAAADDLPADGPAYETPLGKLMFPDYNPSTPAEDTKWMKRVYLYVGRYQRMTGEVKKLGMPLAVVRRRETMPSEGESEDANANTEELEVADIVKYKLVFKNRPEPVDNS